MVKVILMCPVCGEKQYVDFETWAFNVRYGGHPFTCGTESCPSHTVLINIGVIPE